MYVKHVFLFLNKHIAQTFLPNAPFSLTQFSPFSPACPSNADVNTDVGVCGAAVTYAAPVTADNCAVSSTVRIAGNASGANFSTGLTTNTFIVTDTSGNQATCSFTVNVTDNEAPRITCPSVAPLSSTVGYCGRNVTYSLPTFSDNCGATLALITSATTASGSYFAVGQTTVTYRATDAIGLTASCSFTITIIDSEQPVISKLFYS